MKKLSDFSDTNRAALHNLGSVLLGLVDESGLVLYTIIQAQAIIEAVDEVGPEKLGAFAMLARMAEAKELDHKIAVGKAYEKTQKRYGGAMRKLADS